MPVSRKLKFSGVDIIFLVLSVLIALFALFIVYDYLIYNGLLRDAIAGRQLLVASALLACAIAVTLYVLSNRQRLSKTSQKLQTEMARSQTLIDSLGDGVISINKSGIIEFVNPQTLAIISSSEQILIGKKMDEAIRIEHSDGRPVPDEARPYRLALVTGKIAVTDRYFYVRPDRKRIAVAITAAPIIRDGQTIGVVETFRDITEHKRIEKTKDDFVAMTSHQLRTPLSAINWYTEMLLSGDAGQLNDDQRLYAEEVHESNGRLITLVDELLDISRVDLGKFKVEPEPTDLADLAGKVVNELKGHLVERNVSIEQVYDPELPKDVPLDKHLMWIIIQNFLTNAVKYTKSGDTVQLKIVLTDQENLPIAYWADFKKSILISVTDHGIGIPKNQQEKIFTKLFRADNASMSAISGNGLGLYLVKEIVEQNGGKVWFDSEENKGTTFFVNMSHTGMKAKSGTKRLGETLQDPFNSNNLKSPEDNLVVLDELGQDLPPPKSIEPEPAIEDSEDHSSIPQL